VTSLCRYPHSGCRNFKICACCCVPTICLCVVNALSWVGGLFNSSSWLCPCPRCWSVVGDDMMRGMSNMRCPLWTTTCTCFYFGHFFDRPKHTVVPIGPRCSRCDVGVAITVVIVGARRSWHQIFFRARVVDVSHTLFILWKNMLHLFMSRLPYQNALKSKIWKH
jgi:hypothetical protein